MKKRKRTWREATSRYIVDQWVKGTGRCKKNQMAKHWQWQHRKIPLKKHLIKRFAVPFGFVFFQASSVSIWTKRRFDCEAWIKFFRKGNFKHCRYLSNLKAFGYFLEICCDLWWALCHRHRWNVYWNNVDPMHQSNINPEANDVEKRHYLEDWWE